MIGRKVTLEAVRQLGWGACAVLAATALAGCADDPEPSSSSELRTSCAERQIHPLRGKEGRCISGRELYVVADRANPVRLPDATVRLKDVTLSRRLPLTTKRTDTAGMVPANDYFALVELRIANRRPFPLEWRRRVVERAALITQGLRYFEGSRSGTAALRRAAGGADNGRPIAPRATETRVIAFDLPAAAATKLDREQSALFFAADTLTRDAPTTVGVIRLSE